MRATVSCGVCTNVESRVDITGSLCAIATPFAADGALDLLPAETAFAQPGIYAARLLISDARAATLKLANQRDAAVPEAPVLIRGAERGYVVAASTVAAIVAVLLRPWAAEPSPFAARTRYRAKVVLRQLLTSGLGTRGPPAFV